MASDTGFRHRGMTKDRYKPICTGMTGITGGDRWNMGRTLAGGDHSVMTRLAGSQYFGMIHQRIHRSPRREYVTGLAKVGGVDMRGAFARCRGAVMTGDTGIGNARVIKRCDQPVDGGVTHIASSRRRYVRRRLADGNHAVMTGFASAVDLRVIHRGDWRPTDG